MVIQLKEKPTPPSLPESPGNKIGWNPVVVYGKNYFVLNLNTSQIWEGYATCVSEAIENADQSHGQARERWTSENCFAHYICEEIEYEKEIA